MHEFILYQNELVPLLLETYEVYRMASKQNNPICKNTENLLLKLFIQFNPDVLTKVIKKKFSLS